MTMPATIRPPIHITAANRDQRPNSLRLRIKDAGASGGGQRHLEVREHCGGRYTDEAAPNERANNCSMARRPFACSVRVPVPVKCLCVITGPSGDV